MFKTLKKTLLYIKQFGLLRVLSYIRSDIHMRSQITFSDSDWINSKCREQDSKERIVAIIGAGRFAFSTIAYFLNKHNKKFLRCVFSPGKSKAVSLCKYFNGLYVPSDWRDILNDEKIKLVYIASPAETHAEYAVACIKAGKNVYIEKPPVTSESQLKLLYESIIENPECKVFLGFNRSSAESFVELNNFVSSESGFMKANCYMTTNKSLVTSNFKDIDFAILEHICHFTDLILRLVTLERAFPCTITPKEIPVNESKLRFSFSIEFADKSHVSFNYSEIPDFLEGMKEKIELSKGNLSAKLSNFQDLYIDLSGNKINKKTLFRDHGHKTSIEEAFVSTIENTGSGESLDHIEATSKLYLKIIEAMNRNNSTTLFNQKYSN
jgi:polar amino acid transport system substrate-binding protein